MLRNAFTILLICASTLTFAQEKTKKKTVVYKDLRYQEVFQVLKSDKNVKHGLYQVQSLRGRVMEEGLYEKGVKSGIWTFYDYNGEVEQQYNFSTNTLQFNKTEEDPPTYYVLKNGRYVEAKLDREPIFIGGRSSLFRSTGSALQYPVKATRTGVEGTVEIEIVVTADGRQNNERIEKRIGGDCDEEALRIYKLVPDRWLPALLDGKPVTVKFVNKVVFKLR